MNFCQKHWDELRETIEQFGLTQFVSESGIQAAQNLERELKGESTIIDFDPLLGASTAMATQALRFIGLRMMQSDESGKPPCPVCAMENYHWLNGCAYQMALEARKRGLIDDDQMARVNDLAKTFREPPNA